MYTLTVCFVLAGLLVNVALTGAADVSYGPRYPKDDDKRCEGGVPASVVERSFKSKIFILYVCT